MRVKRWESKILRLTVRPRMKAGEDRGGLQEKNFEGDELTHDGGEERREGVEDMAWANYDGDVPVVGATIGGGLRLGRGTGVLGA